MHLCTCIVIELRRVLPQVMTDAAWMMPCSNSEDVIMHVNRLMGAIDVAIRELWISWTVKCTVRKYLRITVELWTRG